MEGKRCECVSSVTRTLLITIVITFSVQTTANPDAKRLYDDLLSDYNRLIRPVGNNSDKLHVKLGLRLSQLIDVNLKNQIMTTNVWVEQEWTDYKLTWNPDDYGGVETLHVPAEHIWRPDIVLYNNADGNYEITIMTKALLNYTGKVRWKPPAIYKSSCQMDVEYFPFDVQTCNMKFGCWTYDRQLVDLSHINQTEVSEIVEVGVDLREYYISVEWDIMKVPAHRLEEEDPCCLDNFQFIYFNITLRRKTLFYTVNLIIPCVGISFMSALVFYLPSDSGEKISLCISILLSLTVFFLLLAEIIPPTSLAVPLLGKYLLFAMTLITLSVVVTICILNLHYRTPSTHRMPHWVKTLFIETLPRFLFIRRPASNEAEEEGGEETEDDEVGLNNYYGTGNEGPEEIEIHSLLPSPPSPPAAAAIFPNFPSPTTVINNYKELPLNMEKCANDARFTANRMKNRDRFEGIEDDWKYIAMVLDRLFLWIFLLSCILGTVGIIFQAPSLYDTTLPLDRQISKIANQRRMQMGPEE